MKSRSVEPGLLPAFRLFTGVQLGALLLITLGAFLQPGEQARARIAASLTTGVALLLLAYLSWPRLERRLAFAYLPLAVLASCAITLAGQFMALRHNFQGDMSASWELSLLLIFPLLVVSWQYGFPSVLVLCVGTAVVDGLLAAAAAAPAALVNSNYLQAVFVRTLAFLALGYIFARLIGEQRGQRRALHRANAELARYAATLEQLTISRERNRLARELHDTLAHTLSGMAVQLEAVRSLWESSPEEARGALAQSLNMARNGLTETRRALQALRAAPLEDLGLALALRGLAESAAARAGLELDLCLPETPQELPADIEQGIYRVAQEALENVVRHAGAGRVGLRLSCADGCQSLTISDDGEGFDAARAGAAENRRFGLDGMRERARLMGGRLEIESQPGRGTLVRLTMEEDRGADSNL